MLGVVGGVGAWRKGAGLFGSGFSQQQPLRKRAALPQVIRTETRCSLCLALADPIPARHLSPRPNALVPGSESRGLGNAGIGITNPLEYLRELITKAWRIGFSD